MPPTEGTLASEFRIYLWIWLLMREKAESKRTILETCTNNPEKKRKKSNKLLTEKHSQTYNNWPHLYLSFTELAWDMVPAIWNFFIFLSLIWVWRTLNDLSQKIPLTLGFFPRFSSSTRCLLRILPSNYHSRECLLVAQYNSQNSVTLYARNWFD